MLPIHRYCQAANKAASPLSNAQSDGGDYKFSNLRGPSVSAGEARVMSELPSYDINDTAPVPSLIKHLVRTFFAHLGCNFPFLRKDKVLRMVEEKRLAPILVDAICSLAARFSDNDQLVSSQRTKQLKSEYGQVFAQRAKALVTDTFLCPTVEALQACLLLAYEAFGDDKDSALWMYTGCAIRMAFDLGLEKLDGIRIQRDLGSSYSPLGRDTKENNYDGRSAEATLQEQKASEQERIDTLWAIFTLDRFISSGLGRPATMRTEDFELRPPVITNNPETGWPAPLPALIQIIHMYGKVSDLLNSIKSEEDVTEEKIQGLANMEREMMYLYDSLDERLTFKLEHFQHYVKVGEGTNFILLNLWFHTLIIVVHWPILWNKAISKLLPNSNHKLSMSSAKTIADMLSCAETLDPKSFVGNPFTSQPTYFAASAFLMESNIYKASLPVSREGTPHRDGKYGDRIPPSASSKGTSAANEKDRQAETKVIAANQNYQRCYKALQQLETYWAGTKYILTALDQKAVGITDPEAFTSEEMESTKVRPGPAVQDWKRRLPTTPFAPPSPGLKSVTLSMSPKTERSASPMVDNGPTQPICWSLTGTTNSPNSNLTFMYQSQIGEAAFPAPAAPANRFYDPIRSSLPESVRAPSATATYSPYTTLNYHHQVAPQQPQPQIPMPPLMASPAVPKYSNIMDDPTALSDAKMLLELQHSPHPYNNRIGSSSYVTTTSVQAPAAPAPQMQQDLYGGTPGYDFATADQNNDMAYNQGWAMSGFIMPGLGAGDMMLSTREIDMYNMDNEMLPWLAGVEYLPQDMMISFDATGNLGRYGGGGE